MRRKFIIPIVVLAALAALLAGVLVGPARGGAGTSTTKTTLPTLTPLQLFGKVATTLPGTKAVHGQFTWTNGIGGSTFTLPAAAPALLKDLWAAGSGEIWYQNGKVRVEVSGGGAQVTAVKNGRTAWLYDSLSGTATQLTLPAGHGPGMSHAKHPGGPQMKAGGMAQGLAQISSMFTFGVSQAQVAGQDAYVLTITPTATTTTLDSVKVAFDGTTFVPLSVQVFAKNVTDPVLSAQFTSVDYAGVAPNEFQFTPPAGATVVHKTVPAKPHPGFNVAKLKAMSKSLTVAQAQAKTGFPLLSLTQPVADLPFQDAHVVAHKGAGSWAILRYGTGLGTVVLAEGKLTTAQQAQLTSGLGMLSIASPATIGSFSGSQVHTPLVNAFLWTTTDGTFHVAVGPVMSTTLQQFVSGLN